MDSLTIKITPLRSNDLRRRTLLQTRIMASPLQRSVPNNPTLNMEIVNDESERLNRRSLVDMQRRLSNIPQLQSPLNESTKFLGEQEMKDHFQICTKLFSENKITTKNAWQLHIIDLLRHMSQKSNSDTLQVASTSLDISAKVYGIRVDDIHSDGLKLASSMARASEKQLPQISNIDDNFECNDEKSQEKKIKKKKRLTSGDKNTISKDPSSLIAPLPILESVFFSTRTNAESNAIDNLFTNTLKMDNSGYKFMLLNNCKGWADSSNLILKKGKIFSLSLNSLSNFKLCIPFSDFQVDDWDPEEEEKQLEAEKTLNSQRENEVVFDENGIPIAELDGSIHDIFSNENNDEIDMNISEDIQEEQEFCAQVQGEIAHINNFQPADVLIKTEYSYNSTLRTHNGKVIDQIWAGPSHWKLKYIRRSTSRFSGQNSNISEKNILTKHAKAKKKLPAQTFEEQIVGMDINKHFKIKKKPLATDLQKKTLPVPDQTCVKLMECINELILKKGAVPVTKAQQIENEKNLLNYEVSGYKYENPNDSQYCSQQNEDDPMDNEDLMDNNFDTEERHHQQQNFLSENLVHMPTLVPKSYVPYALQAKKMDMKKLKAAVWQKLVKNVESQDAKINTISFSNLYNELPCLLNEKMKKELSCPLAFVALLHLCNEQNLNLKQLPGYKDFVIKE
ncbi:unnamed protein product [Brassicogethes aeneus]|uniref:Condensin complex subunit 2 n=1 Tax=Brassicogethes aeneus TaxID=1431903 RepID=A0A9P0AP10_BRAAE|nr:unnamed protein product [Brassicogethes aeneus]